MGFLSTQKKTAELLLQKGRFVKSLLGALFHAPQSVIDGNLVHGITKDYIDIQHYAYQTCNTV